MSLPTNELVFAGVWSVAIAYPQYQFVVSPIDGLCYAQINILPSLGGPDPSVGVPNWVVFPSIIGPAGPPGPPGPAGGVIVPSYGEFVSNTTQNLPANTQTLITFDAQNIGTADVVPAIPFPTPAVRVNTAGVYRAIFSVQTDKTGGGGANEFQFFFAYNGSPVLNTNSKLDETQQINSIMTVESFFSLNVGDTIGVIGFTPVGSVQCRILAQPVDPTHPVSIPSIIFNVQRIA